MNPTDEQLKNRLNPTPAQLQLPGGLFYDADDPYKTALYYRNPDNTYKTFGLANIAAQHYGQSAFDKANGLGGSYNFSGGAQAMGRDALKELGIDVSNIPSQGFQDRGALTLQGKFSQGSTDFLKSLIQGGNTSGAVATQTINNTPNTLAPGVPSGSQPAQTNFGPTAGQNVQTTLDANGNIVSSSMIPMNQGGIQTQQTPAQRAAAIAAAGQQPSSATGPLALAGTVNSSNLNGGSGSSSYSSPSINNDGSTSLAGSQGFYDSQIKEASKQGPQDQKLSDLISQIMQENTQEAGRAAAQTAQDTASGVDKARATVRDLTTKMNNLLLEAQNIQDAPQANEGVTTAIDARQRAFQTNQYAIQARSLQALINSANGNLATAQDDSNRAVDLIYKPIEAQLAANKANLELIAKDPKTTLEEKNQAQAIADINAQKTAAIAAQKDITKSNYDLAVTASSKQENFTATDQYPSAAVALQAIQNAPTKEEGLAIAAATGLTGGSKTGTWSEPYKLGGDYVQKNSLTGEVRTAVNVPQGGGGGSGSGNGGQGGKQYDAADKFLTDNPNASYDELYNGILRYTNLNSTEANALLAKNGKQKSSLNDLFNSVGTGGSRQQTSTPTQSPSSGFTWWNPLTWF